VLKLIGTVDQVCTDFNPALRRAGFLINQYRRTSEGDQYVRFYRDCFNEDVFRTVFPLRGVIGSSRGMRMPVELYERLYRVSTPAAPLFREVAAEWMERVGIQGRGAVPRFDGEQLGSGWRWRWRHEQGTAPRAGPFEAARRLHPGVQPARRHGSVAPRRRWWTAPRAPRTT
jgi:hypothetical protein